jgi:hypothetical protein
MTLLRHFTRVVIVGALVLAGSGPIAAQGPETKPAQPPKPAFQTIVAPTAREIG